MISSTPIHVLVADDHPIGLVGVCSVLRAQPDMTVVAQVSTADDAIRLFTLHKPDS